MSSSIRPKAPPSAAPSTLWTIRTAGIPRGVALAREKRTVLAWDDQHCLYLHNYKGEAQSRFSVRGKLAAACAADDGSAYAAVGRGGEVWWLAPDLTPRWERALGERAVAAALDPFGHYLAVADARGGLRLFDRTGQDASRGTSPRPLHHLAFVPEAARLLGAADIGFVLCFDMAGHCVWRDGFVANVGSLAVAGDGRVYVACYTDGLRVYAADGARQPKLGIGEPCRLATASYDGRRLLAAGMGGRLAALSAPGVAMGGCTLDGTITALGLAALGDLAMAALEDGRVLGLDLRPLFGK